MAKINTLNAHEVARLFCYKTGNAFLVRSDREVLRRCIVDGTWKKWRRIKADVPIQDFIDSRLRTPHWTVLERGMIPSFHDIEEMDDAGLTEATDGCDGIEPDGHCIHGYPSWCLVLLGG